MEKCLAIDIGGSKVLVGVVDETGIVVEYDRKEYSSAYSLETLYADVKRMAAPYMEKYKPEICGVSLPGPVNGDTGVCPLAPFLGIRDWHAAEDLKQILGIPVYAENDANACAVAEKVFGKAADVDDFVWNRWRRDGRFPLITRKKRGRTGRRKRLARLQTKAMKSQLRHTGARQKHWVRS